MEKVWPKSPPEHQLQDAGKKDCDKVITPAAEAVRVAEHLAPPEYPQAKKLCHLHAQLTGIELPQAKKKSLVFMCIGSLWSCLTLCNPVDCGLPGFSVRERGSPGKNTGVY